MATVVKHAEDQGEIQGVCLPVAVRATYSLVPPLGLRGEYDPATDEVVLTVEEAPGIETYKAERSADPAVEDSWEEIEGIGAIRRIKDPAVGTHWFRVKSTRAGKDSAYFGPIAVIVK